MSETSTFNGLIRRLITPAKSGRRPNAHIMNGKVRNVMALMLKTIVGGVVEAHRRHQAYKELAGMSLLELNDIGISRADIHAVVTGVYPRERGLSLPMCNHSRRLGQ